MAKTNTSTYTFTRIDAVKLQFKHALIYASELESDYIELLLNFVEKQYIEGFIFYGFNSMNECELELIIKIDWNQFKVNVSISNTINFKKHTSTNGVSIIVSDWIMVYLQLVNEKNLSKKFSWIYSEHVLKEQNLHDYVQRELNAGYGKPIVYSNKMQSISSFEVHDIPEMDGSIRF